MVNVTDLSTQFASQQTSVLDLDGPVHALLELPTNWPSFRVMLDPQKSSPVEGICLKVRGGSLDIAGQSLTDVSLWSDTAPSQVDVGISWTGRTRSLRLWNAWRVKGVTFAWMGNAGFRVHEDRSGNLTLSCSDGIGDICFEDLTARVAPGH